MLALAALAAACSGGDGAVEVASETASAAPAQMSEAPSQPPEPSEAPDDGGGSGADQRTYVVESGDTLSDIARQFDTTVQAIVRANDIADPDVIDVGQELTIPGP